MPAWMHETSTDQEQEAQQAQRLRRLKARAKATVLGSSQQSPRKQPKGAKGLAKAQARPPGSIVSAENLPEDAEFLLEAWDSDAEEATAKRKAARCRLLKVQALLLRQQLFGCIDAAFSRLCFRVCLDNI